MTTFIEGGVMGLVAVGAFVLLMLFVGALYAFPVMWIWNWMMPELFALPLLTFWQAFWGTFLCGLLFKSSGNVSSK